MPRITGSRQLAQRGLFLGSPHSMKAKREPLPSHSAALPAHCPHWGPARPKVTHDTGTTLPMAPLPAPARTRGRGRNRRGTVLADLPTLLWLLRSSESTVGSAADATAPGLAESCGASVSDSLAGGPAPLWSQDHVLTWTSPGWRVLRKALHLSKPQFPHLPSGLWRGFHELK